MDKQKKNHANKLRLIAETLEARVLYSADSLSVIGSALLQDSDDTNADHADAFAHLNNIQFPKVDISEVVFIDSRVPEYQSIVDDINQHKIDSALVIVIDSSENGVEVIEQTLADLQDVDAVHVISHSLGDSVRLGSEYLSIDTIDKHQQSIVTWGDALSADADILFYGCDIGSLDSGIELMNSLAALTGADIGLTENKTGTTQTGTDWEFEVSSGPLEYSAVVSYDLQQSWDHALYNWDAGTRVLLIDYTPDKFNDNFTYGPGGGKSVIQNLLESAVTESDEISLREAVYASNLVADPANAFTIQLLDETYNIADGSGDFGAGTQKDLEVTNNLTIQGTSETGTILQVATAESRAFTIDAENYSIDISNLTITGGSISSDSFTQGGGAIRIAEGSTVLTDVTLDSNQAKKGGGVYIYGGTLDLIGGHITNNSANGTALLQGTGGGVLTSVNLSETSINGTFFQGNNAYSWGGAIANYSPASILNAEFQGNTSYGTSNNTGGGAIAAHEEITIVDTLINNNFSAEFGGGVVALSKLNISDSTISNNTAETYGGGVYADGNASTITSSTIDLNHANTNSGGGIIVTSSGDLTIDDSVITNNTALASTSTNGYGAGIIVEGKLNLNNSTVAFNQARAFGGIGAFGSSELNIYRTTFFENDADEDGGAIGSGDNAVVTIVNASIVGNTAHDEGGAIYKANDSTVTIANSILDRGGHRPGHSLLFNENLTAGGINSNGYNLITGNNDIDPVDFPDVFNQHHTDLVSKNIDNKDFDANLDSSLSSVVGSHSQHLTINPGNSAQASSDAVDAGGNFDSNIENPVLGWRDGIVNVDPFGNRIDAFVDIGAVEYVHPVQPTKLFWIDKSDNSIWRMNADATGVQEIVPQGSQHGELREYIDLDYDPNTGTLFTLQSYNTATTTYEITYVNADGSTPDDMTPLVFQGTGYTGANPTAPRAIDIVPSNDGSDSYLYVAQNTETPSGGLAENYISKFQISIDNADTTSNIASTWNTLQLEITLPTATMDGGTIDSSSQITSLDVSLTDMTNEEIYVFGDAGNNIDYDILTFNPSENINHLFGRDRITPAADDQTVAVYGAEVDKYFLALHSLIEKGPSIYGAYGTTVEDTENSISVSDIAYDYNYDNNLPSSSNEDGRIWFVDDAGKIGHITGTLKNETTILNEGSINPTKIAIASIVAAPLNPTITSDGAGSTSSINVEENQTLVTSVTAIPSALGHALTYEITGGADASLFNIDASNGNLTFLAAPDFETPSDADTNGVYEVNVRVFDTSGAEDTQQISVTVTDVNESPVITSNGGGNNANINAAENQTAVTSVTATDPDADPDTYTYSLSGADSALFNIDTNGVLTFINPPDFETDSGSGPSGEFEVTVTVDDGAGGTDSQSLNISLTNVNEDPIITSDGGGDDANINAAENQTAVTSVIANDPDPDPDSFTYSLSGADSAQFNIDTNGVLTFINPPDFETDSGSGPSGEFEVTVTVDDGAGGTDSQNLNITLTNVNEQPMINGGTQLGMSSPENQTNIVTVPVVDPDAGDTLTFSIVGGGDQFNISIDPITGALTFNTAPDFENPSDDNLNGIYTVHVRVEDAAGASDTQNVVTTISDTDEEPVITSDGGGDSANINAAENQTAVTTVAAFNPEPAPSTLTYTLSGADSALFTVNTSGVLTFINPPDFENDAGSGPNGEFEVTVNVTNSAGDSDSQNLNVILTDANDQPEILGGQQHVVNTPENQTSILTVPAQDQDAGDSLSFSITGGADQSNFSIDPLTGALSFNVAPDFENPIDADADGEYNIRVTVEDVAGELDTDIFDITITDENEDPVITSNGGGDTADIDAAENQTAVTSVVADDPDADPDTYTYSLSGADSALFNIDTNGVLTFNNAPDFETDSGSGVNGEFEVTVTVDDGSGGTDSQNLNISLTDLNEAPTITAAANPERLDTPENQTSIMTVPAVDPDAGDTLTYSIVGGSDQSNISIDSVTGALTFNELPDFENPIDSNINGKYTIHVQVEDAAGATVVQTFVFTITDVNEDPVITSDGGGDDADINAPENQTAVTSIIANDPDTDPDTYNYSLSGADSALFNIDANGVLSFINAPDFETDAGSGVNGEYEVTVTVNDGSGGTDSQNLNITLDNVNEDPVIISNGGLDNANISAAENQTAVTSIVANDPDPDPDTFIYSLSGADSALFNIDPNGILTFINPPDFETESGSGINGEYIVTVKVNDAADASDAQTLSILVTDENETPSNLTLSANTVNEIIDSTSGITIGILSSVEQDIGDTVSYSIIGGEDADVFTVGGVAGNELILTDGVLDYETQSIYSVQVRASDAAGLYVDQSFNININPINEAPLAGSDLPDQVATEIELFTYTIPLDSFSDPENDALTYSVISELPAWLNYDEQSRTLSGTPSDADVIDGSVSIEIQASDQELQSTTTKFLNIELVDINQNPIDIALEIPASPDRNDPYLIGALTTTDPDINDSHAYTITDDRFEIVGDELRFAPNAETNFFENEIVELEVVSADSGELTTSQSFTIQVSDYLTISVPPALGAAELTVAETPTQVEPEPTKAPTTTSTNDTEPAQPKSATAELTQEPENQQNNTDVEEVDLASLIAPLEKITLEEIALLQNTISPLSGNVSANQLSADLNNRLDFEFDTGFDYANSSEFREMAVEFDRQREELEETQAQYKTLIGSSFTLSSGLSVGYLLWLIRGGTLMGSVLSSLPAWRMVDPLPVLGSLGDDAFEDEESLETMVDDDPDDPTGEADKEAA